MQVEAPTTPNLSQLLHPSTLAFSDIFNTDLFATTPSSSTSGQSPSSNQSSPSPATPYDPFSEPSMFTAGASTSTGSEFFNFMDSTDLLQKSLVPDPFGLGNFDFANMVSPTSQSLSPASGTIDPASMLNTPASIVHDEFEQEESVLPPVKAGGHGKGARKGTVQTGGVSKARALKKASPPPPPVSVSPKQEHEDDLPADWRPSPEALAKMSSKEKRQLRNKISARNFRVRRKEYITTLEGDVSERDKLLAAIRSELGTTQSENKALRAEIAALKHALLSGRPPSPSQLTTDIPAAPLSPAHTAASPDRETKQQHTPPTSPLIQPNLAKDLPYAGPSTTPFWAGTNGAANFTSVHRMVLPELNLERAFHSQQDGENINPLMNQVQPKHAAVEKDSDGKKAQAFDQWSENHLFSLKNMDAYRMQLWHQMAMRQQQHPHNSSANTTPSPSSSPVLTGLASSLRPHFFLGGLSSRSQLLATPASPLLAGKKLSSSTSSPSPSAGDAALATLASQTVARRLGTAFWDAFSGKEDGVSRVLEGKAKLQLVDVEPTPSSTRSVPAKSMTLPTNLRSTTISSTPAASRVPECSLTGFLEESMRGLSLVSKKA